MTFALLISVGCRQTLPSADQRHANGPAQAELPPTLARMQRAYSDLHSGRFVCLADFNTRPQAELFRTLGPDRKQISDQPTISVRRSIDLTGAGGLKARLTSPNDQLLFDGARSEKLALVRDWQKYNLLLINTYGPPGGLTLELTIQSGSDRPMRWTRKLFARPGWHLYRFDLAEVGEEIDLADVRSIRWRAPEITAPVDLFLDDLILADNTRYLLDGDANENELYVFTQGRRIHVGSPGRFELAFSDGLIVEWHTDRSPNLTVRSGLGPWPIPLSRGWSDRQAIPIVYDDPTLFESWGTRVAATQRLAEKSRFRVVIEGIWSFTGSSDDAQTPMAPQHSWRYVVYPSGQVYVRVTSRTGGVSWSAERVGYAIALDGRAGFKRVLPPRFSAGDPGTGFVLMSQPGRGNPDLLWCPRRPEAAARQLELVSADERRIAITVGDVEAAETVDTAHLLRFWPADIDDVPEGRSFAADYRQPADLVLARGRLVTDIAGDLDHDGYNESEGCYELEPIDGLLRFRFSPAGLLRHRPIFRAHDTVGKECWVYADGRIIGQPDRDLSGNLLFALPHAVTAPVAIELNTHASPFTP